MSMRTLAATTALLLAACGGSSSTSPKGQSAAQLAAYYDALAGTHLAAGTDADTTEAEFIEILNGPIAYGQLPTKINVSESGVALTWYANAVIFVDSSQTDSTIIISVWADTTVSTAMLGFGNKYAFSHLLGFSIYLASGANTSADSSTVSVVERVASSSCATNLTITNVYAAVPTYDPARATCTPVSVTAGGHLHFKAASGIAAQLLDVDLTSTTVSAVRLQALHAEAFARVRARSRQARGNRSVNVDPRPSAL